jgi:hypothetical protein
MSHFSTLIETEQFLNSIDHYLEVLIKQRGVSVSDHAFKLVAKRLIEDVYPVACGLLDQFDVINRPGKQRINILIAKLKSWGC